ncbi:hypothetical protein Scep_027180 [Stephania cephalantha]|uniref:Myb-like domain-containing protein n=1 Tax=Stephania cephalantha TaxID=152367 RepID=A0AAP0ELX4_9MAGN
METSTSCCLERQLPWVWIVEALAEFEPVDASLLAGVASTVGELPPNSWCRNARERIAFRHLKDLVGTIDEASTSNSSISLSEQVEHVLLRLHKQMVSAAANGATSERELLRSDVSRFILHKRAILPKSALLQLKDQIGKAGQVSSKFIKEISGLDSGLDSGSPGDSKTQDAILPSVERETNVCMGKENIRGGSRKNNLAAKRISKNASIYRKKRTSKKAELASMENNENSVCVNEVAHFPDKGKLPAVINEANESSKDPTLQDWQESAILVADTDTDDSTLPIAKRIKLSTNKTDPKANNLKMAENEAEILDVSSSEGLHSNEHVDRADDHCTEPEATNTKASNLDKPSSSAPVEDITNVAVKGSFFSFENVLNQDSDRTDRHFCIKCNGGGKLLICSVNSCSLAVHESCVASAGSFDEAGKFSCPFCSLAQTVAAYCEVKRKVALVKEKAALARSGLFKFMSTGHVHREQSSENTSMEDLNQPKVVGDINDINETDILQLKKKMSNQCKSGRKHQQEMEVDFDFANSGAFHMGASVSISNEKKDVSHNREQVMADENHQDAINFIIQEPPEPSTKSCGDDFRLENEGRAVINQETLKVYVNNNEEKMTEDERPQSPATIGKEIERGVPTGTNTNTSCVGAAIDQDHASVEKENAMLRLNEEPIKAYATVETENAAPRQNEEVINAHVSVEMENADLRQNEEPAHGPPSVQNLGLAEASASESDDSTSYVFRRQQRRVIRHANKSSPHSRRQKIPWTTEEVVKLKEGVRRFSSTDGKNMPWKKILLYGEDVFMGSRTAIDLKDKWRNILSKEGRKALE